MNKQNEISIIKLRLADGKTDTVQAEITQSPLETEKLFSWSVKTIAAHPKDIMFVQVVLGLGILAMFSFIVLSAGDIFKKEPQWGYALAVCMLINYAYYTFMVVRQKTIYNYSVRTEAASVEHYLHYPDFASKLFTSVAVFFYSGVFGYGRHHGLSTLSGRTRRHFACHCP